MAAVRQSVGVAEEDEIKVIKYIHYNFEWLEVSEKTIDNFLKGKSKNDGKKK